MYNRIMYRYSFSYQTKCVKEKNVLISSIITMITSQYFHYKYILSRNGPWLFPLHLNTYVMSLQPL